MFVDDRAWHGSGFLMGGPELSQEPSQFSKPASDPNFAWLEKGVAKKYQHKAREQHCDCRKGIEKHL